MLMPAVNYLRVVGCEYNAATRTERNKAVRKITEAARKANESPPIYQLTMQQNGGNIINNRAIILLVQQINKIVTTKHPPSIHYCSLTIPT